MSKLLPEWVWIALLVIAWGGCGFYLGTEHANNTWLGKQAVQERKARTDLEAEVERSRVAGVKASTDQAALQTTYLTLEGKFNALVSRGPLVVVRDRAAGTNRGAGNSVVTDSDTADLAERPSPANKSGAVAGSTDAVDSSYGLSLGAVWVWNSALTATDTPAGACGASDTAAEACAADSGIGIEAAWANHIANAKSCAIDRLRHQQLIDYLDAAK